MMRIKTMIAAAAIAVSTTAVAADMKPAVIYDMGGKFDKSFNEGVYNGVKKFTDETGIEVMEFEVTNETQREQAMRRMAERGATVVRRAVRLSTARKEQLDGLRLAVPVRSKKNLSGRVAESARERFRLRMGRYDWSRRWSN